MLSLTIRLAVLLCHQQRLQGGDVIGQVDWAPSLREACNVYKADVGFQVRSGRRQSMPSSSIYSCACVNAMHSFESSPLGDDPPLECFPVSMLLSLLDRHLSPWRFNRPSICHQNQE